MPQHRSIALLAVLLAICSPAMALEDIIREGSGDRRTALNAQEGKPFDMSLLRERKDWLNIEPRELDEAIERKVIVLVSWSSWYRPSQSALRRAERIATSMPDDVVVIGVHDANGWDEAAVVAERRRASFPIVRDDGSIREALRIDQDPDFYLIDRAGQLRFADVETSSVEAAAKLLASESFDTAAGLADRLAEADRRAREAARRTGSLREDADITDIPDNLSFSRPSSQDYEDADWPPFNQLPDQIKDQLNLGRDDRPMSRQPSSGYSQPLRPLDGRARVVYVFSSVDRNSYRFMLAADRLQRQYRQDIISIGLDVAVSELEREDLEGTRDKDERQDIERARERRVEAHARMLRTYKLDHPIWFVPPRDSVQQFGDALGIRNDDDNADLDELIAALGVVSIMSSDGRLRWIGFLGSEGFRKAFDQILEEDPGVQARRKAEAEYLERTSR